MITHDEETLVSWYTSGMSITNISDLTDAKALEYIGTLIDASTLLEKKEGIEHATSLCQFLLQRDISEKTRVITYYFLGNAYSTLWNLARGGRSSGEVLWYFNWESEEAESVIYYYRLAINSPGFKNISNFRRCQVLTNLGNTLSSLGRSIEAIQYFDKALNIDPTFGMARGNRAFATGIYASSFYDKGHALTFFRFTYADLIMIVSEPACTNILELDAVADFSKYLDNLRKGIGSPDERCQVPNMHGYSLGNSAKEIAYRSWCLNNRLFLNPMNDLGSYPIAAIDVLTTPPIITDINTGPKFHGAFNQLKQGFVSSRFMLYNGLTSRKPHFSDRGVVLSNTLDYPAYSLAVEKVKIAFRVFYSIFDQIAFLLNDYLSLSIPETRIGFRNLWYQKQDRELGLRTDITKRQNRALQALFWLSKDLYQKRSGFIDAIEPEAQELSNIRNQIEHRYLKVHDFLLCEPQDPITRSIRFDELAYSISRDSLERKTIKLAQLARSALIYLGLAMYAESVLERKTRSKDQILTLPVFIDSYDDDWKR